MEAAVWLLAAVSEAGGGPWEANPGLTARALTAWMGEQENWGDELGELANELAEVEETDRVPGWALPRWETTSRVGPGLDLSLIEEWRAPRRSPRGEGEGPKRLPNSGRTGQLPSKGVNTSGRGGQSEQSTGGVLPTVQWTGGGETRGATQA